MKHLIISTFNKSKNLIFFSMMKVIGQGLFYILPLIIAKFISPAAFGSFSLIQMVIMLIITLLLTSSQTPFIVHANQEVQSKNKINKSFTIQLLFFIISLIMGIFIIVIFKETLIRFTKIDPNHYYYIIFFMLGISFKIFFENIFIALKKRKSSALYSFAFGVTNISLILIISIFAGLSIPLVFICYFISAMICFFFFLKILPGKKIFPLSLDVNLLKEVLKWTTWQMFGLLAVQMVNWGDNIVLRCFVSFREIGDYNVGYQLFKGLIGMTFILNTYFLPYIAQIKDDQEKIHHYLYNKRIKLFLLGFIGIFILFFIAPYLFIYFYGTQYPNSILVFQVLLIGLVFHFYYCFYIPLINTFKKYKFVHINNIFIVFLNLGLDYLLISRWGVLGPAIATTIAYFICLVNYEIYFRFFCRLQSDSCL